ncbi:hypothetical protein ACLKA6_005773 [Drosophila palustris]
MLEDAGFWTAFNNFAAITMKELRRDFATEQKMPARRSKAVRAKGHDQEELPELHADEVVTKLQRSACTYLRQRIVDRLSISKESKWLIQRSTRKARGGKCKNKL